MIYGLVGASGVGKSTLASDVTEALDMHYLATSITECGKKHGFDAVGKLSLPNRVRLQRHLLDEHVDQLDKCTMPTITDRTPIDMCGYLMAEFNMHSSDDVPMDLLKEADRYVSDCSAVTKMRYDMVFLLGRLEKYQPDPKRPPLNPAYQRHTDLIMRGVLADMQNMAYAMIASQERSARTGYVTDTIALRLDAHESNRHTAAHIH